MRMSMMDVRKVRMLVHDGEVFVPMIVRFRPVPLERMRMLVVIVVHVRVTMLERCMHMPVFVPLGQMQPDAQGHQAGCQPERRISRLI